MKTCSLCNESKPVSEFNKFKKSPDGLQARCRPCGNAYMRAYVASRMASGPSIEVKPKVCLDCGLKKPPSQFGRRSASPDKLNQYCKPCWRIRSFNASRRMRMKHAQS